MKRKFQSDSNRFSVLASESDGDENEAVEELSGNIGASETDGGSARYDFELKQIKSELVETIRASSEDAFPIPNPVTDASPGTNKRVFLNVRFCCKENKFKPNRASGR